MKNLEEIFHDQFPGEFLYKLTYLVVCGCHQLSRVVPWNLFPSLNWLNVKSCHSIEEIFKTSVEKEVVVSLSTLEKLELEDLPNLKIVCKANFKLECPSLMLVQVKECNKMETFSSKFASTPRLKTIKIEDGQELWNNCLNTTVQQLIKKKHLAPVYDAKFEGERLKGEGLYKEALSQFALALNISQGISSCENIRSECHYKCGFCFFYLMEYEDAIKEFTNALELNPMYADALFARAIALERLSQFEEAITDLKKFEQMEPSNERAKRDILRLQSKAEEVQEIKKAGLGQAYEAYLKGTKLFREGLFNESLSQYESFMLALQAAPEMPSSAKMRATCHNYRARCFYKLRKYEDAIKEHTNALELNPMYANALFERELALERKQFEEAITDLKKVLQMESSEERAKIAFLQLQHMAEEVQEIKKAGLGQAYEAYLKGTELLLEGLYKESLSQYESFMLALQATPEMPSSEKMRTACHYNRAWCFYELGNYEDAIKENTKALELNPTFQNALIGRGLAHEKLGNIQMAIADMKKVLELDPSHAEVKNALLRLEPVAAGQQ